MCDPSPPNGSPRHIRTASASSSRARLVEPSRSAASPSRTNVRKRPTSTASALMRRTYPVGSVATMSGPSARRMFDTYVWSVLRALAGGVSPHSASIEAFGADHRPGVQRQHGQERPFLRRAEHDLARTVLHLDRSEHEDPHRPECTSAVDRRSTRSRPSLHRAVFRWPTTAIGHRVEKKETTMPRFVVERTFTDGLAIPTTSDGAKACLSVINNNAEEHVTWVTSYVTNDRTRTFCVYDGPNPTSIRRAATANGLPVDSDHRGAGPRPVLLRRTRVVRASRNHIRPFSKETNMRRSAIAAFLVAVLATAAVLRAVDIRRSGRTIRPRRLAAGHRPIPRPREHAGVRSRRSAPVCRPHGSALRQPRHILRWSARPARPRSNGLRRRRQRAPSTRRGRVGIDHARAR